MGDGLVVTFDEILDPGVIVVLTGEDFRASARGMVGEWMGKSIVPALKSVSDDLKEIICSLAQNIDPIHQ